MALPPQDADAVQRLPQNIRRASSIRLQDEPHRVGVQLVRKTVERVLRPAAHRGTRVSLHVRSLQEVDGAREVFVCGRRLGVDHGLSLLLRSHTQCARQPQAVRENATRNVSRTGGAA